MVRSKPVESHDDLHHLLDVPVITRLAVLIASLLLLDQPLAFAQSAPTIRTDSIIAEFIGSNARPRCVIRGVFIDGRVDTVKATLKTSTIRATTGGYARYKPVIDSVWLVPLATDRHEMMIRLRLTGQRIPLPSRAVRGVVRLMIGAALWTGDDWASSASEELEVPVANVDIPRPIVTISSMVVQKTKNTPRQLEFEVSGIGVAVPTAETVNGRRDIRQFDVDVITAAVEDSSLVTSDPEHDSLRSVRVTAQFDAVKGLLLRGTITSPGARPGSKIPELKSAKVTVLVRARLRCRSEVGPFRVRLVELEL